MTKKDFFRVVIKLFGLYALILTLFTILPQTLSTFIFANDSMTLLVALVVLIVAVSLFILLLRRADGIIKLLGLDEGFDEEKIHFENVNARSIVKLSALIVGGFMFIDNLAPFISETYFAFRTSVEGEPEIMNPAMKISWVASGLKLLIGYLLINNYRWIAAMFEKKTGTAGVEAENTAITEDNDQFR
jgi:hypothetical protein